MAVNSFKDLDVWQKSMELIPEVYAVADQLPAHERHGLANQLRRSVISVASNIAEGSKRGSRADFRQVCRIAAGSSAELETQLLASRMLYKIRSLDIVFAKVYDVQKMLTKLIQALGS